MKIKSPAAVFRSETYLADRDHVQRPLSDERKPFLRALLERVESWEGIMILSERAGLGGNCFENAAADGGQYAEGLALQQDYWFHHAWAIDTEIVGPDKGKVYVSESTWRLPASQYVGIAFTDKEYNEWQGKGPNRSILWQSEAERLVQVAGYPVRENTVRL